MYVHTVYVRILLRHYGKDRTENGRERQTWREGCVGAREVYVRMREGCVGARNVYA